MVSICLTLCRFVLNKFKICSQAKSNIKTGYQRELNYRRDDNSYSAFGMSDPEGSTWLTAFVMRSFAQAKEFVFVDEEDMNVSIAWLKSRQNESTGCFRSQGKLCHKAMSVRLPPYPNFLRETEHN